MTFFMCVNHVFFSRWDSLEKLSHVSAIGRTVNAMRAEDDLKFRVPVRLLPGEKVKRRVLFGSGRWPVSVFGSEWIYLDPVRPIFRARNSKRLLRELLRRNPPVEIRARDFQIAGRPCISFWNEHWQDVISFIIRYASGSVGYLAFSRKRRVYAGLRELWWINFYT